MAVSKTHINATWPIVFGISGVLYLPDHIQRVSPFHLVNTCFVVHILLPTYKLKSSKTNIIPQWLTRSKSKYTCAPRSRSSPALPRWIRCLSSRTISSRVTSSGCTHPTLSAPPVSLILLRPRQHPSTPTFIEISSPCQSLKQLGA